jgi:hypothetical protein
MEDDTVCRSVAQEELCDPSQALALLGEYSDEVVAVHKKAGRPPEISWLHFGMGVLLCFWRGWQHQRDLWRLLGWQQVGAFAPVPQTDQAIYNRLAQADVQMQALFQQVTAWLRQRLWAWQERELVPFATQVLALDESTLDQVARWLPNLRQLAQGNAQLLAGRLAGLFDVRLQQGVRVELFEEALRDSRVAAWQMIEGLATGTLLLFDRGYFSFPWLDRLTEEGYWWVGRYVKKVSYAVSHVCYEGDGVRDAIVYLGKYRSDQARYPVRLVSFWYQGQLYE